MSHPYTKVSITQPILIVGTLALVFGLMFFRQPLYSDAINYYKMSLRFLEGKTPSFYWPLGWPIMMYIAQWVLGASQSVVKGLSFTLALLSLWLQLSIVRNGLPENMSPWRYWLGYGIIITNAPHILYHANFTFTIVPVAFWGTLLVYTLLFTHSRTITSPLISIMTTVRFGSIFLLPFILIYDWIRGSSYKSLLITSVYVILLVSIPVAAVSFTMGNLVLLNTSNAANLFRGNHRLTPVYETWRWGTGKTINEQQQALNELNKKYHLVSDSFERYGAMKKEAFKQILARPGLFVQRVFTRLSVLLAFDSSIGGHQLKSGNKALGVLMLVLMLVISLLTKVAAIVGVLGSNWPGRHLVYLLLAGFFMPHLIAYAHPSYSQMYINVAIPVVALSAAQVDLKRLRSSATLAAVLVVTVILCHAVFIYYMAITRF